MKLFKRKDNNNIGVTKEFLNEVKKIEGITNKSVKEISELLKNGWEINPPTKKKVLTGRIFNCETKTTKKLKPYIKKNGVFLPVEFVTRVGNDIGILWIYTNNPTQEHRLLLNIDELSELLNEYKKDIAEEKYEKSRED